MLLSAAVRSLTLRTVSAREKTYLSTNGCKSPAERHLRSDIRQTLATGGSIARLDGYRSSLVSRSRSCAPYSSVSSATDTFASSHDSTLPVSYPWQSMVTA